MIFKAIIQLTLGFILLLLPASSIAQNIPYSQAIYSGIPWYDNHGKVVSAHGANIIEDKGKYYLFGEAHTDTSNVFVGFNCYSSVDLYNWKFEGVALPAQSSGKLGPNRVGERCKVMECPKTGEYVMLMHVDTLGYKDQFVGFATSKNITGPYTFRGPLLFNGNPIRKWDMGAFQDKDGSGYVLIHGGEIYKLNDDYKSISAQLNKSMTSGFEAPSIFKKDSIYYFLGSHLTSWEKNDNYYYTSTSMNGPWTARGIFAPEGTLTWNSQSTFVLPVEGSRDTTFLFMGDRWSYPKQASAATYVWQPLNVSGVKISIPKYVEAWKINTLTGEALTSSTGTKFIYSGDKKQIKYSGGWKFSKASDSLSSSNSDVKGASFSVTLKCRKIGLYFNSGPDKGYASLTLVDKKGHVLYSAIIDTYCKYHVNSLKFLSPALPLEEYTVKVSVMGERPNWSDKKKTLYGSTGNAVSLEKLVVD